MHVFLQGLGYSRVQAGPMASIFDAAGIVGSLAVGRAADGVYQGSIHRLVRMLLQACTHRKTVGALVSLLRHDVCYSIFNVYTILLSCCFRSGSGPSGRWGLPGQYTSPRPHAAAGMHPMHDAWDSSRNILFE